MNNFIDTICGRAAQRELSFALPYCRDPIAAAAFKMRLVSEPFLVSWRRRRIASLQFVLSLQTGFSPETSRPKIIALII